MGERGVEGRKAGGRGAGGGNVTSNNAGYKRPNLEVPITHALSCDCQRL